MTTAAIFLPLLLVSLFLRAAVQGEAMRLRRAACPALAKRTLIWPCAGALAPRQAAWTGADPGAIAALNSVERGRRYASPPIATWDRGADRL